MVVLALRLCYTTHVVVLLLFVSDRARSPLPHSKICDDDLWRPRSRKVRTHCVLLHNLCANGHYSSIGWCQGASWPQKAHPTIRQQGATQHNAFGSSIHSTSDDLVAANSVSGVFTIRKQRMT